MSHFSSPDAFTSVEAKYRQNVSELTLQIERIRSMRMRSVLTMGLSALAGILLLLGPLDHRVIAVLPIAYSAFELRKFRRLGNRWRDLDGRRLFVENGLRRVTHTWQGQGRDGLDLRPQEAAAQELGVLGEGSLFELLCTTRTTVGAERLADFLLGSVPLSESRARQDAVRELREREGFVRSLQQVGKYRFHDCEERVIKDLLDTPTWTVSPFIPSVLMLGSVLFLASAIGTWAGILPVSLGLPAALAGVLLQLSTAAFPFSKVRQRLRLLRRMHGDFSLLAQGLALIEGQKFTSSKLKFMVECVRRDRASKHMHRLGTLVALLDQREKPEFYLIGLLTAAGTQMVLAIERWRGRHQAAMLQWLEVWAEMEALCALTLYALEHPGSVFPEFVDSTPELQARSIGHPLLPEAGCIRNDFVLDAQCRAMLITGSNMAGKSTLLRSVGLNVILALAGAPVVADSLTLSRLIVRSSLEARDSLSNGRSKFLAEVERLRDAVSLARSGEPVLFLIDEILSGTNSGDRREAAGRILCHLLGYGAIGALTTHDLALSSLAEASRIPMVLAHMSNVSEEDPLSFDYRLRPGICQRSTAEAIVSMLGL